MDIHSRNQRGPLPKLNLDVETISDKHKVPPADDGNAL